MNRVYVHMMADGDLSTKRSPATKTVPNPAVISALRAAVRAAAARFLTHDIDHVGKRSSVDLKTRFS